MAQLWVTMRLVLIIRIFIFILFPHHPAIYSQHTVDNLPHTQRWHTSRTLVVPQTTLIQPHGSGQLAYPPYTALVTTLFYKQKSRPLKIFLSLPSGNPRRGCWLIALLLLSGDIELNPGPRTWKYPCGVCSKPCKSNQPAIQCDTCNSWIHKKCVSINPTIWTSLANSSVSWECINCGLPNFSSSFFNSSLDHSSPNKFNVLSPHSDRWHSNHISPPRKNFQPAETSTPTPKNRAAPQGRNQSLVTNLVINFQSLKNKIPTFSTHISENPADIIYGTETWLHNKIKDA